MQGPVKSNFNFTGDFYLRKNEREGRKGAEREGEKIPSRLCGVIAKPELLAPSHQLGEYRLSQNQESRLNQLSHPGKPTGDF